MIKKTSVLLIAFNRLDYTVEVLKVLIEYQPPKIYLAMDAPKSKEDELIQQNIIEFVMSKFEESKIIFIQAESNQGTGIFVPEAIDLFFEYEEFGVILEDDCVPTLTFFEFCEQLNLVKESSPNTMVICGTNLLADGPSGDGYILGPFFVPWGWATWKVHWEKFDRREATLKQIEKEVGRSWYRSKSLRKFMASYVESSTRPESRVWTGFWLCSIMKADGLVATPHTNLVTNIGFQNQGVNADSNLHEIFSKESFELQEPFFHESKSEELLSLENDYFKLLKLASGVKVHNIRDSVRKYFHVMKRVLPNSIRNV